jgi:lactate dehydrogenase-like 2-hydroxyacid dehydrogenase
MRPECLVARPVFPDILAQLDQAYDVTTHHGEQAMSKPELIAALQGKQAIYSTVIEPLDAEVLRACPDLRMIGLMGVGYNNVDLATATELGILVSNTPDVLTETTADFGFALLLATARRVTEAETWLRSGAWKDWRFDRHLGCDIHGTTLGIVGMGRIGQAIARRASGFGMSLLYHNRKPLPPEQALGATWVSLPDLMRQSDHIMLILPYSQASHHIIGAPELALMKPTATLINLARGGIVDDAALVAALQANAIAGAGLDVFEHEPNLHPGFFACKNVVLTPHIASASIPTRRKMAQRTVSNLLAFIHGIPPDCLNPGAQARRSAAADASGA